MRRRAADLLEENGQVENAVRLLQEIGDWETLIHLILKHAPVMDAQGRYSVLEGWLRSLPQGLLETRPWLCGSQIIPRLRAGPKELYAWPKTKP
ncbi:MAG: hypothetical protein HY882_12710 [Deltaproteobacteria bacterium]|nr:hypothetical protein [Deltaproteobacteria bacterium]